VSFHFLDPKLGAVAIDVEVTHFGATVIGAKVQNYFMRDVDVAACVA
jgi:predicted thioesterase